MPMIPVHAEQLLVLSTLARTSPAANSPLRRLVLQLGATVSAESQKRVVEELAQHRVIVGDAQGRPRLAKQIELPLHVLHRPEQTICFTRAGPGATGLDWGDTFFCRSGAIWVQNAVTRREPLEILAWPFRLPDLQAWFATELMADVQVRDGGEARHIDLLGPELIVLCVLQAAYRRRIEADSPPLKGTSLLIHRPALADPDLLDAADRATRLYLSRERLTEVMADDVVVDAILDRLEAHELVHRAGPQLGFARTARTWFDPGRQQAVVALSDHGQTIRSAILTALDDRWLLQQPLRGDPATVRFSEFPGATSREAVLSRMLEALR